MEHSELLIIATEGRRAANALAVSVIEGDEVALMALHDHLEEEGDGVAYHRVGDKVFIQTVTYFFLGRIKSIDLAEIVLEEASCVYDTGRFNEFLRSGKIGASEPFVDDVVVHRGAGVTMTRWRHDLPTKPIGD